MLLSKHLKVGSAQECITPKKLFTNWIDNKPYPGILDPLYVKAVVLEQSGKKQLLLVFDLVDTRHILVHDLRKQIQDRFGISPSDILVHATHTHSAPRFPFCEGDMHPDRWVDLKAIREDKDFIEWCSHLPAVVLRCTETALSRLESAQLTIQRIYAGDWVYNRRPIRRDGTIVTDFSPKTPYAQPEGRRFGLCDPTLTALQFLNAQGHPIASLLHFACHSVAIYPSNKSVSADWPGMLCRKLSASEGGIHLFLQGCAGDQVPVRRGRDAAEAMTDALASRLRETIATGSDISPVILRTERKILSLPLLDGGNVPCEVQVLQIGDLAIVALPGEPLIGLALEIQRRSPFPHTICLGYSNGHGTAYVGMPGEKARGGYESSSKVSHGTDECGHALVEASLRLLGKLR